MPIAFHVSICADVPIRIPKFECDFAPMRIVVSSLRIHKAKPFHWRSKLGVSSVPRRALKTLMVLAINAKAVLVLDQYGKHLSKSLYAIGRYRKRSVLGKTLYSTMYRSIRV